jgi:hypothetical protein
MDNNRNARTALDWAPEGKRKRGRPKETWRRTVEKERKHLRIQHMGRGNQTSARLIKMERTFLFPSGAQSSAVLAFLLLSILRTFPIHCHLLFFTMVLILLYEMKNVSVLKVLLFSPYCLLDRIR